MFFASFLIDCLPPVGKDSSQLYVTDTAGIQIIILITIRRTTLSD